MSNQNYPFAVQEKSFFDSLLDNTCSRLEDKQAQYSLKRLDELDAVLGALETELDLLIRKAVN